VENYRSLRDLTLSDLGSLNVFIGKNSSGKSNIIEALNLFFAEYSTKGGTTQGLNDHFWYRGVTTQPILFRLTVLLSDEEVDRVFHKDLTDPVKRDLKGKHNEVEIQRSIVNVQGTWKTDYLKWAGLSIVENDQTKSVEEVNELFRELSHKNGSADSTLLPPTAKPETLVEIHDRLLELMKNSFKLLTLLRDGRNADRFRTTLTDENVQTQVWNLDQAVAPPEDERYGVYEGAFTGLTGIRLDPAQGKLMVRKEMRRFSLDLEGGGIQSSANLLFNLFIQGEKSSILSIEEPEAHFHPGLQRKLSNEFGRLAKDKQLFIATHSPSFLVAGDYSRTWLVRLSGNESDVTLVPIESMQTTLEEVELRPSDVLFSNKIVFVEGKSDKIVLRAFAERLEIDLTNIELVPIRGKRSSSRALEAWIALVKDIAPVFLILDNDAQNELNDVIGRGLIGKESTHVWRAGSIESYYPQEALSQSLDELSRRYSLNLDVAKLMKKIQSKELSPDEIEIGSKGGQLEKSWDLLLAEEVAKRVRSKVGEIPDEAREILITATALPYEG